MPALDPLDTRSSSSGERRSPKGPSSSDTAGALPAALASVTAERDPASAAELVSGVAEATVGDIAAVVSSDTRRAPSECRPRIPPLEQLTLVRANERGSEKRVSATILRVREGASPCKRLVTQKERDRGSLEVPLRQCDTGDAVRAVNARRPRDVDTERRRNSRRKC